MLPYLLNSKHWKKFHIKVCGHSSHHPKYHVPRYTELQVTIIKSPIQTKITVTKHLMSTNFWIPTTKGVGIPTDKIFSDTHIFHLKCTYLHFYGCILLLFVFRLWR
jgi:hypothetical protein